MYRVIIIIHELIKFRLGPMPQVFEADKVKHGIFSVWSYNYDYIPNNIQ